MKACSEWRIHCGTSDMSSNDLFLEYTYYRWEISVLLLTPSSTSPSPSLFMRILLSFSIDAISWKWNEIQIAFKCLCGIVHIHTHTQFINNFFYWNVYIVTNQQCSALVLWSTTRSLWTNNSKNQCWFLMFLHTNTHTHTLTYFKLCKLLKWVWVLMSILYPSGLLLRECLIRFYQQFEFESEVENQTHNTMWDYMGLLTNLSFVYSCMKIACQTIFLPHLFYSLEYVFDGIIWKKASWSNYSVNM